MEAHVLELLMSRVCHDLISPVGAIVNGVELIEENGSAIAEDAMALIAKSARLASRRLQFYRIAYGAAGTGSDRSLADARQLATDFLLDGKVTLDWPDDAAKRTDRAGSGGIRLLLNLIAVGVDALPRGGKLKIGMTAQGPRLYVAVTAEGTNARLDPEVMAALAPQATAGTLQTRTVQAFFAAQLAAELDARLTYDSGTGRVVIEALLPAPEPA